MTTNEQLLRWVNGESIHNPDTDECCPDFSCCAPDCAMSMEDRAQYYDRLIEREMRILESPACRICGQRDELRFGVCFDCAFKGEERAARRSVAQHLWGGLINLAKRDGECRYDFVWAWERLTRTGDYAPGGYFERKYHVHSEVRE